MSEITQEIVDIITANINAAFGNDVTVKIEYSHDDDMTFLVNVYNVRNEIVREVKDFIYDLGDKMYPEADTIFLAMVKNVDITRQYYPEMIPKPMDIIEAIIGKAIKDLGYELPSEKEVHASVCMKPVCSLIVLAA